MTLLEFCIFRGLKIRSENLTGTKEEMANRIMTNLIMQLASLGRHANDIFGKNKNVCSSLEDQHHCNTIRVNGLMILLGIMLCILIGNLEKEASFMQKRMVAIQPRIEAISHEIQVVS